MSRLAILGATGSLGSLVLRQALDAGHQLTVVVRTPSKLTPDVRERVRIHEADLTADVPIDVVRRQDALICCAGHVSDGNAFIGLVDRVVTGVDASEPADQPVCWFLAGAALLDIDRSGRRGVDFPEMRSIYWPHEINFARLSRSRLDWRLLCPGPMVDKPPLGLDRLRISLDVLPVAIPSSPETGGARSPVSAFTSVIPEMIVPYADAATLMLANVERGHAMSRHRVGLALPVGMRGSKP
jgi:putative NADH-flavin reductase